MNRSSDAISARRVRRLKWFGYATFVAALAAAVSAIVLSATGRPGDHLNVLALIAAATALACSAALFYGARIEGRSPERKAADKAYAAWRLQVKQQRTARVWRLLNPWFVRYPLAALLTWGAVVLIQEPKDQWLAAVPAVAVLILAREIGIAVLVLIVIVVALALVAAAYNGIAALPVSVAVIIGAVLIASAVKKK